MTRHGTKTAMYRHRTAREPLCDECRPLWNEYMAARKKAKHAAETETDNAWVKAMDAALEANPPVIIWRKNSHGVREAIYVDDPHAEREPKDRRPKGLRDIDIEYLGEIS